MSQPIPRPSPRESTGPADTSIGPVRFGPFEFDPTSGELRRDGQPIKLQQQPGRVLALLLRHRGQVVSRKQIQQHVWGDGTFVDFDRGLNFAIMQIRSALGDDADAPRFVETLPRRGYRFVAAVESLPSSGPATLPPLSPPSPSRRRAHRALAVAACAGLLLAGGYLAHQRLGGEGIPRERVMVAVLPFDDLNDGDDTGSFGDGLTEELIAELGRVEPDRMGVIARTSVMSYKGHSPELSRVGRELSASHVLEGSVRRNGPRARITVRLVRVSDQSQIWAASYDEHLRDVLSAQARIATSTAQAILLALKPAARQRLSETARAQVPPEAYRHYLLGRHLNSRRDERSLRRAIVEFDKALALAAYAPAYAGLAEAHALLGAHALSPPDVAFPEAKRMAQAALRLDGDLASAHAILALVAEAFEWDLRSAERGLLRALSLNPSHPQARHWYAVLLTELGRTDEALTQAKLALEIDPLSPMANVTLAGVQREAGLLQEALEQARLTIDLEPGYGLAHRELGKILWTNGRREEGIEAVARAVELDPQSRFCICTLGCMAAKAGRHEQAAGLLARLQELDRRGATDRFGLAILHAALGETDQALQRLEQAVEAREPSTRFMLKGDTLEELRDSPLFSELAERVAARVVG